jgi:tetratricopeptide (TPR) repeat protein
MSMSYAASVLWVCSIFVVLNVFIPGPSASAQNIGGLHGERIPEGKIEIAPDAVAPAWQLVWDKARDMGRKGNSAGAIALYKELLKDRPGLIEARRELATLLLRSDDKGMAIPEFEQVVEAHPNDTQAAFQLAELFRHFGQCDRAVVLYANLLAKRNDEGILTAPSPAGQNLPEEKLNLAEVETGLALCYIELQRYEDSIAHLQTVLSMEPGRRDLELILAYNLIRLRKEKTAVPHLRNLFPHKRGEPLFLKTYAQALLDTGDLKTARAVLEEMLDLLQSGDDSAQLRGEYMPWAIKELVTLYLMDGDTRSAVKTLKSVEEESPELLNPPMLKSLGRLHFASHDYLSSLETFVTFLKNKPDDREALLFMARAYDRLQLLTPAVAGYKKVLRLGKDAEVLRRMVELLVRQEDFRQAHDFVDSGLRDAMRRSEAGRKTLLTIYIETGDGEGIDSILNEQIELLGENDVLYPYISLYTADSGEKAGHSTFEQGLRLLAGRGDQERLLLQIALQALSDTHQYGLAADVLKRCWDVDRTLWPIETLAGLLIKNEGALQDTLGWFEVALKSSPSCDRLLFLLADLYVARGRIAEAGKLFDSTAADQGSQWGKEQRELRKGMLACLEGRYGEALHVYGNLLEDAPNHLEARRGRLCTFSAYGLLPEAQAESLGLLLLTEMDYSGTIPKLFFNGREVMALGVHLDGPLSDVYLPSSGEVLESSLCQNAGEACPLLVALSFEEDGKIPEAIVMWTAFLKRHKTYWPGYGRLASLYGRQNDTKNEQKQMDAACSLTRLSKKCGRENPSGAIPWSSLEQQAIEIWEKRFCAE